MNKANEIKIAVVYKSKYGASEKYSKIIANKLSARLFNLSEIDTIDIISEFDIIIWGGGIYAGKINGLDVLYKNMPAFRNRRMIVFSVGNTPADRYDVLEKVRARSIPSTVHRNIQFFHFVARANFSNLKLSDRMLLGVRRIPLLIKSNSSLTEGERLFLTNYRKDLQVIDEEATEPLIESACERNS